MLDVARQPSRLAQLPPALDESRRDIAALERGEARLVACYLRNPPGHGRRGPRQGGLELSATAVSWRAFFGLRRPARLLDISGITLVRPAGPSDQRFGVPGNLHLFSLVRCATPAGRLDLLVPTADLPLVTWRLSGGDLPRDVAMTSVAMAGRAGRRPPSGREICWPGLGSAGCVAIAVVLIVLRAGWLALVPLNLGGWLAIMSISGGFRMWRHRRNAVERHRRKGT
jgi:hypothetical protein